MMLNVFRPHCDLKEVIYSIDPASDGFDNCGVSAYEVLNGEQIRGRYKSKVCSTN